MGNIKEHECIEQKKVEDMNLCLKECQIQSEPVTVFFDSKKWKEFEKELLILITKYTFTYKFLSISGREHRFWRLYREEDIKVIQKIFEDLDCLYIGDGHHRINALKNYYNNKMQLKCHGGDADFSIKIFARILSSESIGTTRFIRVYDSAIVQKKDIISMLALLQKYFYIKKVKKLFTTKDKNEIIMVSGMKQVSLRLKEKYFDEDIVSSVEIFEKYISPILLQDALKCKKSFLFIGEKNITEEKINSFKNEGKTIFMFSSPSMNQIISISNKGRTFPQKSTFVEPKIEDGIIFMAE